MSKRNRNTKRTTASMQSATVETPCSGTNHVPKTLPEDVNVGTAVDDHQVTDDDLSVENEKKLSHKHGTPFMVKVAGWMISSEYDIVRRDYLYALKQHKEDLETEIEDLKQEIESIAQKERLTADSLDSEKNKRDSVEQENKQLKDDLNRIREDLHKCDDRVRGLLGDNISSDKTHYESLIEEYKRLSEESKADVEIRTQTPLRSLADMLSSPNAEEKTLLYKYVRSVLNPVYNIPDGKEICAFIEAEISGCRQRYSNLEAEKMRIENESKEKDTPDYFKRQLTGNNPKIDAIVNDWIKTKVNAAIHNEDRKLECDTLALSLKTVADSLNAPRSGEEAAEEARKESLKAISDVFGFNVESIIDIRDAARLYADKAVKSRVFDKIEKLALPESDMIERINADIDFAEDIRRTLERAECQTIEDFRDNAVIKSRKDLQAQIERRITEAGDQELIEIVVKNKGSEAMVVKMAGIAKRRLDLLNRYIAEAEKIDSANNAFAEEANMRVEGDNLSDRVAFIRSMIDEKRAEAVRSLEIKTETLDELKMNVEVAVEEAAKALTTTFDGKTIDERLDQLNSKLSEKISSDAERISTLERNLESETSKSTQTFNAYLSTMRTVLEKIGDNTKAACNDAADSELLRNAVETNILYENPAGDYEYFCKDLLKSIEETYRGDADCIRKAIRATVCEYQQSSRATWIDVLVRLYLYSRVPFISEQFLARNIYPADLARGVEALTELLAMGGLSLTWPELFRTQIDEGDFDFETIRNIDSYVDDVAGHVGADNVVIDLYCVGLAEGEEVIKKPIVSLFN